MTHVGELLRPGTESSALQHRQPARLGPGAGTCRMAAGGGAGISGARCGGVLPGAETCSGVGAHSEPVLPEHVFSTLAICWENVALAAQGTTSLDCRTAVWALPFLLPGGRAPPSVCGGVRKASGKVLAVCCVVALYKLPCRKLTRSQLKLIDSVSSCGVGLVGRNL